MVRNGKNDDQPYKRADEEHGLNRLNEIETTTLIMPDTRVVKNHGACYLMAVWGNSLLVI